MESRRHSRFHSVLVYLLARPDYEGSFRHLADYYVVVRQKEYPPVWEWKIQRRSKPMGVQIRGTGFSSETAARLAGEKALREFFNGLSRERNRSGSGQA